jgi:hypothetical protein
MKPVKIQVIRVLSNVSMAITSQELINIKLTHKIRDRTDCFYIIEMPT